MLNKGRLNITTDVSRLMSTERCHDNTPISHRTASNQLPVCVLSSASPESGCADGSDSLPAVRGGGGRWEEQLGRAGERGRWDGQVGRAGSSSKEGQWGEAGGRGRRKKQERGAVSSRKKGQWGGAGE